MAIHSSDIRIAAIERSLLDLDRLMEQGVEHSTMGETAKASEIYTQLLAVFEERFGADIEKIPVDVVTRSFRVLLPLAECHMRSGQEEEGMRRLEEARALATGPLAEYPEFTVLADVELCRTLARSGNSAGMKTYLNEAGAAAKVTGDPYLVALVAFATGLLFSSVGRHSEAINIFNSASSKMTSVETTEGTLLKAEIMLQVAQQFNMTQSVDEAANTYSAAVEFLVGHGARASDNGSTLVALRFLMLAEKYAGLLPRTENNTFMAAELYNCAGNVLNTKGLWNKSLEHFAKTIELFQSAGRMHPRLYALAYLGMSDICIGHKEYSRATAFLEKARKCSEEYGDMFCVAKCLYFTGLNLSKGGDDVKGMECFEEAAGLLAPLGRSRDIDGLKARVNNQMGFIEAKRRRPDEALAYFEESVDLLREYPHEPALAEAHRLLGEAHCARSQHAQSERALKKALEIHEKQGALYECARCYKSLGENSLGVGDLQTANFFLRESMTILEALEIEADLPMVYSAMARVCLMQEDFESAEKLYQKDFDIAKKTNNAQSLAFSYYQLGRTRRLLKRTHSAEDFLQRSVDLFENAKNQNMAGLAMVELSLCVLARRDTKTATDLCARAQAIFEKAKNQKNLAAAYLVRGVILRDTKDSAPAGNIKRRFMAQRFMEDAIHILEKINKVSIDLAEAYYEFALFWRDGKDRKRAVEYITEAIDLCKKLGVTRKAASYLEAMQQISPEDATKMRLSSLVDKAAVDQIIKKDFTEGVTVERKNLTILFTDIRNFTTISESLELDALTSFLNDFYNDVSQAIARNRGSINKFIGDAVMAIFNMDGKLEDHAVWAVRAAVELSRSINETNLMRRRRGEIDISIGVGINTGEVLIGSFGSSLRQDYTAIGDGVNVASRIQNQAKDGDIMVTPAVYEKVKGLATAVDMGETMLKGKDEPVRLWKITGIKD